MTACNMRQIKTTRSFCSEQSKAETEANSVTVYAIDVSQWKLSDSVLSKSSWHRERRKKNGRKSH